MDPSWVMNHDERMNGTGTYFSENNTLGYINLGHFRGAQIVSVQGIPFNSLINYPPVV